MISAKLSLRSFTVMVLLVSVSPAATLAQGRQQKVTITFSKPDPDDVKRVMPKEGISCTVTLGEESKAVSLGKHDKDLSVTLSIPKKAQDTCKAVLSYTSSWVRPAGDGVVYGVAAAKPVEIEITITCIPDSEIRIAYGGEHVIEGPSHKQKVEIKTTVQTGIEWNKRISTQLIKEIPVGSKSSPNVGKVAFEQEHTIKHSYTLTGGVELEASVKANWLVVEAGLKARIHATLGTTVEGSTTTKRSITVDGDKYPQALVLVLEEYRSGKLVAIVNGTDKQVLPFEFRDGFHFECKAAD